MVNRNGSILFPLMAGLVISLTIASIIMGIGRSGFFSAKFVHSTIERTILMGNIAALLSHAKSCTRSLQTLNFGGKRAISLFRNDETAPFVTTGAVVNGQRVTKLEAATGASDNGVYLVSVNITVESQIAGALTTHSEEFVVKVVRQAGTDQIANCIFGSDGGWEIVEDQFLNVFATGGKLAKFICQNASLCPATGGSVESTINSNLRFACHRTVNEAPCVIYAFPMYAPDNHFVAKGNRIEIEAQATVDTAGLGEWVGIEAELYATAPFAKVTNSLPTYLVAPSNSDNTLSLSSRTGMTSIEIGKAYEVRFVLRGYRDSDGLSTDPIFIGARNPMIHIRQYIAPPGR